ncbi:cytochrome c1 [Roseinatronobacter alkalisoli]|uniref:Cytochrome c1 n=1 Tax=Roseinatronobacter alkalisoli TaxID=3028235 RepID=A0ABT5TAD8_9RHOB|nr:cytochrome c1 [Roseinatronobacter sp. HJB301]MDD7972085.1 cytochrome c1 [Roseinatronobacter sp. HJB301]
MFRKLAASALTAATLMATPALAAGGLGEITDYSFSFEGPFGVYDRNQLQRGLQVYTEVCSSCHGLEFVAFRTLSDRNGPELPDDQMRAYAEMYEVWDEELRDWRTAAGPDHFPESQFEGAPDLSLMAKARVGFEGPYGLGLNQLFRGLGGAEYIASFLTGYTGEEDLQAGTLFYYNKAYDGWVSMNPVLFEDMLEYADGTPATEEQMAQDVAAFLMWTAEPKLVERKRAGFVGVIFLSVLAALLYLTNKQLWAPIKRAAKQD